MTGTVMMGRLGGAGIVLVVVGCTAVGADRRVDGVEYRPPDDVVRLTSLPLDGDDIGLAREFEIAGDTIYLLDVTGRVVIIERDASRLRLTGHFGRRGGGPGEFLRPSDLALIRGALAVVDGTRIQFFTLSGNFVRSLPITLPCPMMLPSIAHAEDGLLLHGSCLRRGIVTDTMNAVLAWSADTAAWDVILQTPRFATDGSVGSAFGARSLLTSGPAARHVFGGGETNCIWSVTDAGDRPLAEEICPAAGVLYTAEPPPGLEERLRAGRFAAMNLEWPETLPVYVERFQADREVVLVRPFSADSVVLQTAAPTSVDLAVAPLAGLLGCRTGGCMWLDQEGPAPRLIVLDRATIETMVARAVER